MVAQEHSKPRLMRIDLNRPVLVIDRAFEQGDRLDLLASSIASVHYE